MNAPVYTLNVTENGVIVLEILVTGFSGVGAVNLRLRYSHTVMTALSADRGSSFPGGFIANVDADSHGEDSRFVTMGWYTAPGLTLPDGSVFARVEFERIGPGGPSVEFHWVNSESNSTGNDQDYHKMNDEPRSDFYVNYPSSIPVSIAHSNEGETEEPPDEGGDVGVPGNGGDTKGRTMIRNTPSATYIKQQ